MVRSSVSHRYDEYCINKFEVFEVLVDSRVYVWWCALGAIKKTYTLCIFMQLTINELEITPLPTLNDEVRCENNSPATYLKGKSSWINRKMWWCNSNSSKWNWISIAMRVIARSVNCDTKHDGVMVLLLNFAMPMDCFVLSCFCIAIENGSHKT